MVYCVLLWGLRSWLNNWFEIQNGFLGWFGLLEENDVFAVIILFLH